MTSFLNKPQINARKPHITTRQLTLIINLILGYTRHLTTSPIEKQIITIIYNYYYINDRPTIQRLPTVWVFQRTKPFNQSYYIGAQIGEAGNFGVAHRVKRKKPPNEIYVAKIIKKSALYRIDSSLNTRQAILLQMKNEIDIMRLVRHPYIVELKDVREGKNELFLIMEECKGGELFERILKNKRLNENEAKRIIRQVFEALCNMHEVHRLGHFDLKPDNILFKDKTENSPIKIIDFGMSKVVPRLQFERNIRGTPYYIAPEVIKRHYTYAADCWSAGVILFVMLFGYPPFDSNKDQFSKDFLPEIYNKILKGFSSKVKKNRGPWFPRAIPISENCRDFITQLLNKDQAKRMSAKEALQHVWLLNKNKEEIQKKTIGSLPDYMWLSLSNFTNKNPLKYLVSHVFQDQYKNLRPKHFANLKMLFSTLDKKNTGQIEWRDFKKVIGENEIFRSQKDSIKKIFKQMDRKRVGKIDFNELLNAIVLDYLISNDQRLYDAFRELDKDDDGMISVKDLKTKLKEVSCYGFNEKELQKLINECFKNEEYNINNIAKDDNEKLISYEQFLRAVLPDYRQPPKWFWESKKKEYNKNNKKYN